VEVTNRLEGISYRVGLVRNQILSG